MVRRWAQGTALAATAALALGCNTGTGHKVLSFFFDGVPEPGTKVAAPVYLSKSEAQAASRRVALTQHGPYAAKLCDACHNSQIAGGLVAPKDQLCGRCHEEPAPKRYVHGPYAAGACTSCHNPHSSGNRYLLSSATGRFCLDCHERSGLTAIPEHGDLSDSPDCTSCHSAHMSDRPHLLKGAP